MRKLILLFLPVFLLSLAACGTKTVTLDPQQVAADLLEQASFAETLNSLSAETAASVYNLDEETTCIAYASTGATAEEVAVFTAPDEAGAKTLVDALNQRLADRTEAYQNYLPDEVYKLEHAVLQQLGKYVILCVAKDSDPAEQLIHELSQ